MSIKSNYNIYLKDIILNNNSNDYITIEINDNNIYIDYTNLVNTLENKKYDTYTITIEYK